MKWDNLLRLEIKERERESFRALLKCEALVWLMNDADLIKKIQTLRSQKN